MSPDSARFKPRLLFLVTEDWYFCSHRLPVARAARDAGFDVAVATRVTDHGPQIVAEGFCLHPLSWRRRGDGILGNLRALAGIVHLYRQERPSIVHHVSLKPVVFGSLAARMAGVTRVVNAINGLGFVFTAESGLARTARVALRVLFRLIVDRRQTVVLFQNEDDRQHLLSRRFLRRSATAVVRGSGVDITHFRPLPEPPGDPPTIALVTRMVAIKGVDTLVDASRLLRDRGVPHRLLLVGAPDPDNPSSIREETLRAWAEEPGISWLGRRQDVREIWAKAHVAVLTSHGGEGLPKTLLEAAACGRPIVATDVAGSREIAIEGVNALVVPPRDPVALAAALERLLRDPDLRSRFGAAGRSLVEVGHSDQKIAAAILVLYDRVMGRA